ncbi:MAG: type II toxin-antitoxin system VapC family toxin [Candidatus Zhuqueibacterota bacterium]
MNNIIDISSYAPKKSEPFLFDTNIWMYLYCPLGNYNKKIIRIYDQFLKRLIQANSTIYISSLILSEFFNAYCRLEFNIKKKKNPSRYNNYKKDFRTTQGYRDLMTIVMTTVKSQILKLAQQIDDDFSIISVEKLFSIIGKSDFNDCYYHVFAEQKSIAIVTDDRDFWIKNSRVKILTANKHLLKKQ